MPCSSQPNGEFARAPTWIFVWRQAPLGAGRMGKIYIGRENPFRAFAAGLATNDLLPLREAVDERRCREEAGAGTLAEAAAAYRPDPKFPGCGARGAWRDGPPPPASRGGAAAAAAAGSTPSRAPSSSAAESRSPHGPPSSGPCATTSPSSVQPRKASHES